MLKNLNYNKFRLLLINCVYGYDVVNFSQQRGVRLIETNELLHLNKDNNWWKKAVFYQVYPRSFKDSNGDGIGDLKGVISKLDYLNDGTEKSLGIDAIWFSPFFKSPDFDYGYDVADYCDIDPRYGSLADFDFLLAEAHRRNIMIMLDLVVNHTSHLHPWFLESRSSRDNPKRNWYIWKDGKGKEKKLPNNWRTHFFGPAWTWDEKTGQYYLHSFLKEQPDLNWFNSEVREAVGEVIRFWLNRGVDGFRLDVAHHYCKDKLFCNNPPFFIRTKGKDRIKFSDRTLIANIMKFFAFPTLQVGKYNQHQPETHQVLREFRQIFDAYPAKTSVGEILGEDAALVASYYGENNDELHMNFYFELAHCRWQAGAFRRCIERWERNLPKGAWPAHAFSNHDLVRAISRYDHDGNGDKRARLLMLMLLTFRGTPFIYYGEELSMKEAKLSKEQLKDPAGVKWYPLHRGRDGCRTPMQWNESAGAGFSDVSPWLPFGPETKKRNAALQQNGPHSQLALAKKLIWLRKSMPALLEGTYSSVVEGVPADCFCYLRETKRQRLMVCVNFSTRRQKIEAYTLSYHSRIIISTDPHRKPGQVSFPFALEPDEGCIIDLSDI